MTPRLLIAAAATLVASFVLASLAHADGLRANAGYTGLYDPFPEIQHPCINDCERHGRRHHRRHRPPPPDSGPPPDQGLLVDCSGHGQFATLQDAVKAAQPNDVIEILAPGEGMTCVGTVDIHIPLTIRSAGGGARAVLQAPDHQSCLTANIPLGDALTIENVTFIARGREKPCVHVTAGKVLVRNSKIDSRNTNWAFDVDSSGDLTVEDSTIETDGSGVHAERATVCLKNIHVAVEEGHYGIGVGLDRTDGTIEGGTFIGGAVGILASSGPRGLKITDSDIRKARTAMRFAPGQQGQVEVSGAKLRDNIDGVIVASGTDAVVSNAEIIGSSGAAAGIYGGGMRFESNTINSAAIGILVETPDALRPLEHLPPELTGFEHHQESAEIVRYRPAIVKDNTIQGVGVGIQLNRRAGAVVTGNSVEHAGKCIAGGSWWHRDGDNICH